MKKSFRFIPNSDANKDLWLKNFATKLPQYATKYNIADAEQTDITQSSEFFTYWLNYKNQLDEYNKKLTLYKNEIRDGINPGATASVLPTFPSPGPAPAIILPGVFTRAASIAYRIKKHVAYTIADGKDLGIEAVSAVAVDAETLKPIIKVRIIKDGIPEILWTKKGMDRLEIHVDRGEGFEFLAYDTYPHYQDINNLEPGVMAIWKYKAIYFKNDSRVGLWSDEVSITVTGMTEAA